MLSLARARTRFAPSPTGDLHLGGAFTALASWWLARRSGADGTTVLRVEDIDRPRVVAGAEERQHEDLAWMGLDWDEEPGCARGDAGPYRQTDRLALYDAALADLTALGRSYPCDCSRAEIARVASAPHNGEEITYPGTCRDKDPARSMRRAPAVRLRIEPHDAAPWTDGVVGTVNPAMLHAGGDFVLRRGDGVYAYQLAVSVDDLAMAITDVVRGDDLLASTPRQLLLMKLWQEHGLLDWAQGRTLPRYWHLPLVRARDGTRLAKRTPGSTLREVRALGVTPATLVGHLGHGLGILRAPTPLTARALASMGTERWAFRREPWAIPEAWG